jgi:hypothetical protein
VCKRFTGFRIVRVELERRFVTSDRLFIAFLFGQGTGQVAMKAVQVRLHLQAALIPYAVEGQGAGIVDTAALVGQAVGDGQAGQGCRDAAGNGKDPAGAPPGPLDG